MKSSMKTPKCFVSEKDLKSKLEELLEEDKINVIILKEEKRLIKLHCKYFDSDVLLELNEEGTPVKILGCKAYKEENGYCTGAGGSCIYFRGWKKLKPFQLNGKYVY